MNVVEGQSSFDSKWIFQIPLSYPLVEMNKVPENAWEVVGTMHFISKEIILTKRKNGHANQRRGNATIINFNTLSDYMLIALLWSSYSSYLIAFAMTIDTHYWALPNSTQVSRWNLVVDNNMTITTTIANSLLNPQTWGGWFTFTTKGLFQPYVKWLLWLLWPHSTIHKTSTEPKSILHAKY